MQFGGSILAATFREQTKKWEDITYAHVSDAIVVVHHFIVKLLDTVVPEKSVRDVLWENIMVDELRMTYGRAMSQATFLLETEREVLPITYNHYFSKQTPDSPSSGSVEEL